MNLSEEARLKLVIDGRESSNYLDEISAKMATVKQRQEELGKRTKENAAEYDALRKELSGLKKEYEEVSAKMDVNAMSVKQLEKYQKDLLKVIKDLTPGSEEYVKSTERYKEVSGRLGELRKDYLGVKDEVEKSKGIWGNLGDWIKGAFTFAAILEAGRMLWDFLRGSVTEFKDFEKAAQELKGETQMSAETLEFFKQKAKETGPQFGITAKEMLQAYNAIASGKSDLLESKEALAAVADEAVRLSIVSGMPMEEAAKTVVESLNQYGAGAEDAAKYVDILATGTIVGAGKINEISASLRYVGPVAKAAGLSFGETNAALQILAQNGIKGEQAGTALRGMLAQLMKGANETNPSIVGMQTAFDNLAKKNLSAKDAVALFGTEAVSAGLAIVNNNEKLKDWTGQIEKGGGAATMFADKTNSMDFQLKQSEASLNAVKVGIGEMLLPVINAVLKPVGDIIKGLAEWVNGNSSLAETLKDVFSITGEVISLIFKVAVVVLEAVGRFFEFTSAGQKVFGVIQLMIASFKTLINVIGLLADGLAFLTGGLDWEGLKKSFKGTVDDISNNYTTAFQRISENNKKHLENVNKDNANFRAKEVKESGDTSKKIAENDNKTHADNLTDKEKKEAAKRQKEIEKEREKRDKIAEEEKRATEELLTKIDKAWADSLSDELTAKKVQLMQKYEAEVKQIEASKAAEKTKADYLKGLHERLVADLSAIDQRYFLSKIDKIDKELKAETSLVDYSLSMQEKAKNRILSWEDEKQRKYVQTAQKELDENEKKFGAIGRLLDGDVAGFAEGMGKKISAVSAFKLTALGQYAEFYQKVVGYLNDMVAKFADVAKQMIDISRMRIQVELNMIEQGKQAETKAVRDELKKQEDAVIDLDAKIAKLEEALYFEKDENRKADLQSEIDKLNKEKEAIVVQKNATTTELTKIEKDYDNKVRQQKIEAWQKQKDLEIKLALINATQSYIKALSSGFPPFNFATAALVMKAAQEQVQVIRSEPVPEFAQGTFQPMRDSTYFENAGVLGGVSHSHPSGGNWVINPENGKLLAKVEKDEFLGVFSRGVTARYGSLLARLANSSLARTGKPVYAENGFFGNAEEGVPADVSMASELAVAAGLDLSSIDENTMQTAKNTADTMMALEKVVMAVDTMKNEVAGILSDIAVSSRITAEKPPVSVRNITIEAKNMADVVAASSFS